MTSLRVKGASFSPFATRARADYQKVIINHPDGFDALLYRPVKESVPEQSINTIEFGDLNSRVDDIDYHDPVQVVCVESTSDDESFLGNFDNEDSMGYGEAQTLTLRISEYSVPEGSIVEFLTLLSDGSTQRQFWYVHRSSAVGVPAIGFIHYLIPCGDIEHLSFTPMPANDDETLEAIA